MMGSTITPLKRQRSVKFHIDETSAKPSIKITVSSDALAETLLKNNVSTSSSTVVEHEEDSSSNGGANQQQPALIQIVGKCCTDSGDGLHNPPPNGVLCNCANGDDKRTRIALDDFTVLEFPNCIDFGIKDFLCCRDEIELDLSSDTDASYLDATPPHRFSDSELDNQIEAMSITLDTQLNPYPNNGFLMTTNMDGDEDEEEETTEESFVMDEEEVSSSASNSAATICGAGDGSGVVDLEHDDHLSGSTSKLPMQGESQAFINCANATSQSTSAINEVAGKTESATSVKKRLIQVYLPKENVHSDDEDVDNSKQTISVSKRAQQHQPQTLDSADSQEEISSFKELKNVEHVNTKKIASSHVNDGVLHMDSANKLHTMPPKILHHPKKHFKRQISLPASIFMSYLLEQNNKTNYGKQSTSEMRHHQNEEHHTEHNCDIFVKNKLNRSHSCNKRSAKPCHSTMRSPLSKIDSYRSAKVIHGSIEDYEYEDINISNAFNGANDTYPGEFETSHSRSSTSESDERNNPLSLDCTHDQSGWAWESKSDSFTDHEDTHDAESEDDQEAFTSEVEKRSLILRHVRRLIRQDTSGNFAPPDFSI